MVKRRTPEPIAVPTTRSFLALAVEEDAQVVAGVDVPAPGEALVDEDFLAFRRPVK